MSELQQDTAKFIVGDDEIVYRLISSPAGYNEITGVSPDCFKLFRKNESYVCKRPIFTSCIASI
jgi:hypothetical protein